MGKAAVRIWEEDFNEAFDGKPKLLRWECTSFGILESGWILQ